MIDWMQRLFGETRARLLSLLRRAPATVTELAEQLELTDNAVRTHVAALGRDRLIEPSGTQRDTGGKPARRYTLTTEGEELFPKAYAFAMGALLEELARLNSPEHVRAVLQSVGTQVAKSVASAPTLEGRVTAAAEVIRGLGGDLIVTHDEAGWRLQGFGCPLSALTGTHPELCGMVQAVVGGVTGQPVTECCDRTERPRCAFVVSEART